MKIYLTGFMSSGKTTIGRRLSYIIGYNFVDTDYFIEMQQDMTINDIFVKFGEAAFREMEHKLLIALQKHNNAVISTGGGMPCHNDNMDIMLANGTVVYLKTSPQALSQRLLRSYKERPLVNGKTEIELQKFIDEQLAIREPIYNRANIVIDTENYSMENLLRMLNIKK